MLVNRPEYSKLIQLEGGRHPKRTYRREVDVVNGKGRSKKIRST